MIFRPWLFEIRLYDTQFSTSTPQGCMCCMWDKNWGNLLHSKSSLEVHLCISEEHLVWSNWAHIVTPYLQHSFTPLFFSSQVLEETLFPYSLVVFLLIYIWITYLERFQRIVSAATTHVALSLVQVTIQWLNHLNEGCVAPSTNTHTHTHTSDIGFCHGRTKQSICPNSASFGHPWSAYLPKHHPPDERGTHFSQFSLDCHLLVCFPYSGESGMLWYFDLQTFSVALMCLSLRSSPSYV